MRSRRSKGEGDLDTYSTVQYSTLQHITVQYSTVQYRPGHGGGGEGRELGNVPVLQPDVGGGLFAARAAVLVLTPDM